MLFLRRLQKPVKKAFRVAKEYLIGNIRGKFLFHSRAELFYVSYTRYPCGKRRYAVKIAAHTYVVFQSDIELMCDMCQYVRNIRCAAPAQMRRRHADADCSAESGDPFGAFIGEIARMLADGI